MNCTRDRFRGGDRSKSVDSTPLQDEPILVDGGSGFDVCNFSNAIRDESWGVGLGEGSRAESQAK